MRIVLALAALAVASGQATCTTYCTAYFAACSGAAYNVYSGADQTAMSASCMAECAKFAQTGDDTINNSSNTGNNIGCREYHALAAASTSDPATHCPHARPDSADGVCRSMEAAAAGLTSGVCDNYCDNLLSTCATPLALLASSRGACIRACARYRDQATPVGMYPVNSAATGDASCRRYHVEAARTDTTAAETHCPHADLLGGGVCGTPAFNFCQQATGACMNNQTGYTDAAACEAIWPNIPLGTAADTSMDTRGCRAYHLSVALGSDSAGTTHCPHTGQAAAASGTTGTATCGTACEAYCSQYASVCANVTAAAKYATMDACKTACAAFATTGMVGASAGNTLQCRLYHLGVAATGGAATATHCPHAAQDGGGATVCGGAASPTAAPGSSASSAAVSALALAVPVLAFLRV